jgi:hypothetical protein
MVEGDRHSPCERRAKRVTGINQLIELDFFGMGRSRSAICTGRALPGRQNLPTSLTAD